MKYLDKLNEKFGKVVFSASEVPELRFLPFGIIALDVITHGGIPLGRISEIWGKRSCGKSTLALKLVKMAQNFCKKCFAVKELCKCKSFSAMKCFYIDAEGTFSKQNAIKIGVNLDELRIGIPDYLEQAMDMCELAILDGMDVIILDTLASLASKKEIEDSTADKHMAEGARSINQGLRKVISAMNNVKNRVAVILFNQVRENVGIQFGNRDIKPGGLGQDFVTSLEVKLVLSEYKFSKDRVIAQIVKAICMKCKYGTPKFEGEFMMYLTDDKFGETDELEQIIAWGKRYDVDTAGIDKDPVKFWQCRQQLLDKIQNIDVLLRS